MLNLTKEEKLKHIEKLQSLANHIYTMEENDEKETKEYKKAQLELQTMKDDGIIEDILNEASDIDTQFTFEYCEDINYRREDVLAAFNEYEEYIIEDKIDDFYSETYQDDFNVECHYDWLTDEIDDFCAFDNDHPIIAKGYMKKVEYIMNLDRERKEKSHDNFKLEKGRGYNSYIGTLNHQLTLNDDTVSSILWGLNNDALGDIIDNLNYNDWVEYYEAKPILEEWCECISRAYSEIDITDTITDKMREWVEENNIPTSRHITDEEVKARLEADYDLDKDYLRNKIILPFIYNGRSWTSNIEEIKATIKTRQNIVTGHTTGDRVKYEEKTQEMIDFIPKLELAIKYRDTKNNLELAEQIFNNNDRNIYRRIAYKMAEKREENRENRIEEGLDGMN